MSRQIHPGLFGDNIEVNTTGPAYEPLSLFEQGGARIDSAEVEERLRTHKFETEQFVKSATLRMEKLTQKVVAQDQKISDIVKEANEKLAFLAGKVKELQKSEMKVEALFERHNQIVHNFETRLSQAQRIIENQGLQLIKQTELIDEAKRQIEKLKRL